LRLNVTLRDGISPPVTSSVLVPQGCRFNDFAARVAAALGLPSAAHVGRIVRADGGGAVWCGRSLRELRRGESLAVAPLHVQAWDLEPVAAAATQELARVGAAAMLADRTRAFVALATSEAAVAACDAGAVGASDDLHAALLAEAATIQHHAAFDAVLEAAERDLRGSDLDAAQGRRARAPRARRSDALAALPTSCSLGALGADFWLNHETAKTSVEKDVSNGIWDALVAEVALEITAVLGHS
jgi:hypothetical protein